MMDVAKNLRTVTEKYVDLLKKNRKYENDMANKG
jgi:hypothetical protein